MIKGLIKQVTFLIEMDEGVSCELPLKLSGVVAARRTTALTFCRRGNIFSVACRHADHLIDRQLQLVPTVLCRQDGLSSEILGFAQPPGELKKLDLVVVKADVSTESLSECTWVKWSPQAPASPSHISHVVEI